MSTSRSILLAASVLAAGCSTTAPATRQKVQPQQSAAAAAPQPVPASALVDRGGDSVETAITVPADAPDEGVGFENDWIFDRIGRFRRTGGGTGQLNGRRYDIVEVETPKAEHFKYFFDITENWKKWRPQSTPQK